jgi:hypothetical protein
MCCSGGDLEQHGTIRKGEQVYGATMGLIWDVLFGLHDLPPYSQRSNFFVDWGCFKSVYFERGMVRRTALSNIDTAAGISKRGGITLYSNYRETCDDLRIEEAIVVPCELGVVEYDLKLVEFKWERVSVYDPMPLWGSELEAEMANGQGFIIEREGADGREFLWRRRDRACFWDQFCTACRL